MIEIRKMVKSTALLLSKQPVCGDKKYRWLLYTMRTSFDNGVIINNFLTGQVIFLKSEEMENLHINKLLFEKLVECWMLVPDDCNDRSLYNTLFLLNRQFIGKNYINNFKIFTTSDCNARCFYCFEHGSRRYPMTEKTARDTAQYIHKVSDKKNVKLHWFGGEPLYNDKPIDIITNYLRENSIDFESEMTSNGYLFNRDLIEHAKNNWNLSRVQITLDGTADIYNNIKSYIYKDDKNPFLRVINNIKELINSRIIVYLRLNLGDHNESDIYSLVEYIKKEIGSSPYLHVYSWLIYENSLSDSQRHNSSQIEKLYEMEILLEEYLYNNNLKIVKPIPHNISTISCMAEDDASVVILPDGHIGKCDHFIDNGFVGSIYSDNDFNKEIINSWKVKRAEIDLCSTCQIFPQCRWLKECPAHGRDKCTDGYKNLRIQQYRHSVIEMYKCYLNENDIKH